MIKRFLRGMREKDSRKLFGVFLAGKMLGVTLALGGAWLFTDLLGGSASAAGLKDLPQSNLINATNTAWTLLAAFLVFFMQAGFMLLEAGFARERETVNVLLECIVDTCLCALLFYAFGFAFMFGTGNSIIGHSNFFLNGHEAAYGTTGVAFLAFFLFQFAFADTASTVTSGAMVGRTGFVGDLLYSVGVSGFIYPILGHWVWGPGGWLGNTMGWFHGIVGDGVVFRDFAGSTVVHTVGGFISLAGAIVLGPRIGRKFARDGGGMMPGHDMTIAAIGGVILWFGWYGFNPGSTLSALDANGIGRVSTNTTLAACSGGLVAMAWVYPRLKKWDIGITVNGFLAGLVAITCPCYWVSPTGAVVIGAVAAVVCVYAIDLLEYWRIDDPIGAVAVHGFAGIWGTLSLGLFGSGSYGLPGATGASALATSGPKYIRNVTGLFYGGGFKQLEAQAIGSATITICTFLIAMGLFLAVKATKTLRVSEAGELEGIDIHEHGGPAYRPEFGGVGGYTLPGGGAMIAAPAPAPEPTVAD